MRVLNVHERLLAASPSDTGALIDSLASEDDRLWPGDAWPRMHFDRPLGVGARGGHGPIRYVVEAYEPGKRVRFRFTGPAGFDGWHGFEAEGSTLRHVLDMRASGRAALSWPLVYRPLHDALIEDALANAQGSRPLPWSAYVRFLRRLLRPRPRQ